MRSWYEKEKWMCRKIVLEDTSGDCLVCLPVQGGTKAQVEAGRTYPKRSLMIVTSHVLYAICSRAAKMSFFRLAF